MRFLPDGDSMKAADKDTIENLGIPSLELMERAARSCVDREIMAEMVLLSRDF